MQREVGAGRDQRAGPEGQGLGVWRELSGKELEARKRSSWSAQAGLNQREDVGTLARLEAGPWAGSCVSTGGRRGS